MSTHRRNRYSSCINGKLPYTRRVHYESKRLQSEDRYVTDGFSLEQTDHIEVGETQPDCAFQPSHPASNIKIKKPKKFKYPFTYFDFMFALSSISFFFYDCISDIVLATEYLRQSRWLAFGFTTGFIAVPAILSNSQSARWYLVDYEREQTRLERNPKKRRTPLCIWICRVLFTFPLMLGPVVRHVEYIHHGIKSKSKNLKHKERWHHYKQMLYEESDAGLVRMFEGFLEAAPQLVLQLFILFTEKQVDTIHINHMQIIRPIALIGSWIGLSWSLVSYQKALRAMQHSELHERTYHSMDSQQSQHSMTDDSPKPMNFFAVSGYFLWRVFEVGPRLLILSLFASQFTYFVLIAAGAHWIAMTLWLLCQKTNFYGENRRRDEIIFNIVLGYAMVFCFLNARDGHTRFRAIVYYLLFYVENFLMMLMWVYFTPDKSSWMYFFTIAAVPAGFILHLTFQLIYYKACHPKAAEIEFCLHPTHQYSCYQSVCHSLEDENEPNATTCV